MDAAERQSGSSVDHKTFTQQIHKPALIITAPICMLPRLIPDYSDQRNRWRADWNTNTFFLRFFQHKMV